MTIGWINQSTRPAKRTTLAENPGMSKNVRRHGQNGSKGDFPHSSTGGHEVHESEVRPSDPAHSNTKRLQPGGVVKTIGVAPDGSGRYSKPDYAKTTDAHSSDSHYAPLVSTDGPSWQAHYANIKFGKETQRPAASKPTGGHKQDSGALAGDSGARTKYTGGKGPVRRSDPKHGLSQ